MWKFGIAILMGAIAEVFFIITHAEPSLLLRVVIAVYCALSAHIWHHKWFRSESG